MLIKIAELDAHQPRRIGIRLTESYQVTLMSVPIKALVAVLFVALHGVTGYLLDMEMWEPVPVEWSGGNFSEDVAGAHAVSRFEREWREVSQNQVGKGCIEGLKYESRTPSLASFAIVKDVDDSRVVRCRYGGSRAYIDVYSQVNEATSAIKIGALQEGRTVLKIAPVRPFHPTPRMEEIDHPLRDLWLEQRVLTTITTEFPEPFDGGLVEVYLAGIRQVETWKKF